VRLELILLYFRKHMLLESDQLDIAKRMESNFANSFRDIDHDTNASFWEDDESTGFITGYPETYLNYIFKYNSIATDTKDHMARIVKRFKDRNSSAAWFVGAQTLAPEKVKNGLVDLGFIQEPRGYSGMLLDKTRFQFSTMLEDVDIQKVENKKNLKDFVNVFQIGFQLSDLSAKFFQGYFRTRFDKPEQQSLFVAYIDNQPVGISAYYLDSGIIMIHSVSTLPEHRCKGYGKILTEKSILEALKFAELPVTLYGSQMAERLYQNIGFDNLYMMDKFIIS